MGKTIDEIIEEPVFKIGDIEDVSYRQINDWEEKGLIAPARVHKQKGWRLFSVMNLLTLKLIRDLKKHNLPNGHIKQVIEYVMSYKLVLQTGLINQQQDRAYLLVCDSNKVSLLLGKNIVSSVFETYSNSHEPILMIPIGNYFCSVVKQYYKCKFMVGKDSDIHPLKNMPINIKEEIILDVIRDKTYNEILIQKRDEDYIIRPKKRETNRLTEEDIIKLLKEKDFQNIEVKIQNGKIIALTSEEVNKV